MFGGVQVTEAVGAQLGLVEGKTKVSVGKAERYHDVEFVSRYRGGDEAAVEVQARITLPEGTRLDRAVFQITAAPGGATKVSSVASLREAEVPPTPAAEHGAENGCAVDFGRLVSINTFYLAAGEHTAHGVKKGGKAVGISRIFPWTGAGWAPTAMAGNQVQEMQTERLLVTSTSSADDLVDAVTTYGVVGLPAQPGGLELQVEGMTVWFERQGSTAGLAPATAAPGTYTVDRTDAVRDALAKARPAGGNRIVTATLRTSTPGDLSLTVHAEILHEYHVPLAPHTFTSTTPLASEQLIDLDLSEHDETTPFTATDSIRKVSLTVSGTFGPERVEPVEEPIPVPETRLVLGGGRTVLLGIPAGLVSPFGALQAVRLLLSSEKGGEVAGRLLAGDLLARPGAPVTGGEVPPVTIAGSPGPAWMTLPFPDAVALAEPKTGDPVPAVPYWLELTATYGEVVCGLTRDPAVPAARLLRRLPGGGTRALTGLGKALPQVGTEADLLVPLRVVGLPGKKQPLPAVTFRVEGPDATLVSGTTPVPEGLTLDIGLGDGVPPRAGKHDPSRRGLPLQLRVGAPGTLTLENVVVLYQKGDKST